MPRQIEAELINAIRAGVPFDKRHHAYSPMDRTVSLYGTAIIQLADEAGIALWASLSGFNTPRTRQTINAVAQALIGRGPVLTSVGYSLRVDGRPVSAWEWFPVMRHEGHQIAPGDAREGRVRLPQPETTKPPVGGSSGFDGL